MEKLSMYMSEIYLRRVLYSVGFLMKIIVPLFLLCFVYSEMGMYQIICMNNWLAFTFCAFIQITVLLFDFYLFEQIEAFNDCVGKIIKIDGAQSYSSLKMGNQVVNVLITVFINLLALAITCWWGEIIDQNNMGFIVLMSCVSLLIMFVSFCLFYKSWVSNEKNEAEKQKK